MICVCVLIGIVLHVTWDLFSNVFTASNENEWRFESKDFISDMG